MSAAILDLAALAGQAARGRRPEFTGDPLVERLFSIALALTTELAVTRERLDTLERALARRDVLPRDDIEHFEPDASERRERGELQAEYLARIFRALLEDAGTSAAIGSSAGEGPHHAAREWPTPKQERQQQA